MQPLTIEIITDSGAEVVKSLLQKDSGEILSGNRSKSLDDGSTIELSTDYTLSESFGLYETISFVLTFASGVGASMDIPFQLMI